MGPETKELIGVLDEIIELLESHDEENWTEWLRESRRRLEASDGSGIEHLLWAYEGMGSFNDLMIGQLYRDGRLAWAPGAVEKNDRLQALRGKAYQLVDFIKNHCELAEPEP